MSLLPMVGYAQQPMTFESITAKYGSKQGATTIELSKDALQAMGVSNGISHMEAIAIESASLIKEFCDDLEIFTVDLKAILSVNSNGESVKIYGIADKSGSYNEMIIFTANKSEGVAIRLKGENIELKEAKNMLNM